MERCAAGTGRLARARAGPTLGGTQLAPSTKRRAHGKEKLLTAEATRYSHLIVGGGVAADKAARAIRQADPEATIGILTASLYGPLYRPALSKGLWQQPRTTLAGQLLDTHEATGAVVHTGVTVTDIDAEAHRVSTADGAAFEYSRLLLATGAEPAVPSGIPEDSRIVTVREPEDYVALRDQIAAGTAVAVVGAGYIASEVAAGLATVGAVVEMHYPAEKMLDHMFPDSITIHLAEVYGGKGIRLNGNRTLTGIAADDAGLTLSFESGKEASADVVVLAVGVTPALDLAERAGAEIAPGHAGVVVGADMSTSVRDIWAAGDIVYYEDPILGQRRVEHVAHAEQTGTIAGTAMTGHAAPALQTPMFYSDLFDDGYEAVGEISTEHKTLERWNPEKTAAVISYVDGDRIRGVLLWNTWNKLDAARRVLAESAAGEDTKKLADRITPGA